MDNVDEKNMDTLMKFGVDQLANPVARVVDKKSGRHIRADAEDKEVTNEKRLQDFAEKLSYERKLRLQAQAKAATKNKEYYLGVLSYLRWLFITQGRIQRGGQRTPYPLQIHGALPPKHSQRLSAMDEKRGRRK